MALEGLDHCAIRTTRLEQTRSFYVDGLGLEVGPRPPLSLPGYWLYAGGQAVVHLMEIGSHYEADVFGQSVTDQRGAEGPGVDHLAFRVSGLAAMRERLSALAIPYRELSMSAADLHQVFAVDPNGVIAELNFKASAEGV
ncbi:VOC family protein [Immundisolibacter sp.]|uniref:VOC family protein n=1 Tax=Immundisolibacter sp. TaxID=1934948 RepID=UPI0035662295